MTTHTIIILYTQIVSSAVARTGRFREYKNKNINADFHVVPQALRGFKNNNNNNRRFFSAALITECRSRALHRLYLYIQRIHTAADLFRPPSKYTNVNKIFTAFYLCIHEESKPINRARLAVCSRAVPVV